MTAPTRADIAKIIWENEGGSNMDTADAILDLFEPLKEELAALQYAPITEGHKDGMMRHVGAFVRGRVWVSQNGYWDGKFWRNAYDAILAPTHAAPLPQPPENGA